jgi:hypothetical protein
VNPELWLRAPWLVLASWLPVPLGVGWLLLAPRLPAARSARGATLLEWLTWLGTRAAFALLLWGVMGHLSVDLTGFFVPQAERAAAGGLPYRDFPSAHAPLFPFALGLGFRLGGALGIAVLFVLADLAAWWGLRVRDRARGARGLEGAAWLYLAFPPTWYFTIRYSQDEPLSAMGVAWALDLLEGGSEAAAGAWMAAGYLFSKPLFALAALPLALAPGSGRRHRWLAALVPVAATYLILLALGVPVWQPFVLLHSDFGHGPTLWRIPFVWYGLDLGPWAWPPLLLALAGGAWWLRSRGSGPLGHAAWIYACFALLSPKAYPMYVVIWAPLLAAWVAEDRSGRVGWWALYGALLPLSLYLDSGPLQGMLGAAVQWLAAAGMLATAGCAVWLLARVARDAATARQGGRAGY